MISWRQSLLYYPLFVLLCCLLDECCRHYYSPSFPVVVAAAQQAEDCLEASSPVLDDDDDDDGDDDGGPAKIANCAKYQATDDGGGALACEYCVSHYELDHDGNCSPCVVCQDPFGSSSGGGTVDFCPIFSSAWGGVVPHKPNGDLILWPLVNQNICDKFVFWGGADGYYPTEDDNNNNEKSINNNNLDDYYCSEKEPVIWMYNISLSQQQRDEQSSGNAIVDRFSKDSNNGPMLVGRSGRDVDPRLPMRGVYACSQDTVIVQVVMEDNGNDDNDDDDNSTDSNNGLGRGGGGGISIHWHGMLQRGNQFMNGVPMLSQCPLWSSSSNDPAAGGAKKAALPCLSQRHDPASNVFTYRFRANPAGTFFGKAMPAPAEGWYHHRKRNNRNGGGAGGGIGNGAIMPLIVYEREPGPFANDYNVDLEPLVISDWWQDLAQTVAINMNHGASAGATNEPNDTDPSYFYTQTGCKHNRMLCTPAVEAIGGGGSGSGSGSIRCDCASDENKFHPPLVGGYMNGLGQFPLLARGTMTRREVQGQHFYTMQVQAKQKYRLRIIHSGWKHALRFSMDQHRFTVIAADGAYHKPVQRLTHLVIMPGERYDVLFEAKSASTLEEHGYQYFVRAASYNATSWEYKESSNDYQRVQHPTFATIYGVLNYDLNSTQQEWFQKGQPLAKALGSAPPPMTKILDLSMYYNGAEYAKFHGSPSKIITQLYDYRYPDKGVPGCAEPHHDGRGPVGASFGCDKTGMPLPVPEPDHLVHLAANGILWPAHAWFTSTSPVLDYDEVTSHPTAWTKSVDTLGKPNMFAAPATVPLLYSRGMWATQNLNAWGASPDSPGYDPGRNPPQHDWGNETKYKYGRGGWIGVTNFTQIVYLPINKWVMVVHHNDGPEPHPFHLNGNNVFTVARRSNPEQSQTAGTSSSSSCGWLDTGTVRRGRADRRPIMLDPSCNRSGGSYMNGYGASLVPPARERYQPRYALPDVQNQSVTNMLDPPVRDTVVVPGHGYVAYMFYTGNPGAWLYHTPGLELHPGLGMGTVMMVGADDDDWINGGFLSERQMGAFNQGNCPDNIEFQGPIQFFY